MSSRAAPPRALVLAAVVAAHAGALLALLAETRTRLVPAEAQPNPLLVIQFQPQEHQAAAAPPDFERPPASRDRPPVVAEPEVLAPAIPAGTAIDWAAAATAAAALEIEAVEQRARQARALAPKPSAMFAQAPRRAPGIPWNYAATHRVEPVGGLTTVIHLNDQCTIVLFVIIPFAGGCALEKPAVRGDLFEHMHDPDPGPQP